MVSKTALPTGTFYLDASGRRDILLPHVKPNDEFVELVPWEE
jgi:hypothetical protein